jgi:hypothetical protein
MLAPPFQYSYLYLMPDAVIEQALRDAQNILWRNLPPTQSQSDEAVVRALRDIVRSARVKSVLERGSDTDRPCVRTPCAQQGLIISRRI